MIISRAPYRLSLFGGGSDFPTWCQGERGVVVSGAINHFCYVTIKDLPPFFDHNYRVVYSSVEEVNEVASIHHPAVRAVLMEYWTGNQGLEVHHVGDLPARSGIGSSSAFVVALIGAVLKSQDKKVSQWDLALRAIELEQEILGEVGGFQDQIASALGGVNVIEFIPEIGCRTVSSPRISAAVQDFGDWLLLFFSGKTRTSADISAMLNMKLKHGDVEMAETVAIADHAIGLLSGTKLSDFSEVGRLLTTAWESKKRANPMAESPEVAVLINKGLRLGALGGKVAGAGGGGFVVFCVRPEDQDAFTRSMEALSGVVHVPFAFGEAGQEVIHNSWGG